MSKQSEPRISSAVAAIARKWNMHVIFGLIVKQGTFCRNGAVIVDGQGEVVGCYFKSYPVEAEIATGITAGGVEALRDAESNVFNLPSLGTGCRHDPLGNQVEERGVRVQF